jgi:hypothetical protein
MKQNMGYSWAKYTDIKLEICTYNDRENAIKNEKRKIT